MIWKVWLGLSNPGWHLATLVRCCCKKNIESWNAPLPDPPNFKNQKWGRSIDFFPPLITYDFPNPSTRDQVISWKLKSPTTSHAWPSQDQSELHHLHQRPRDQAKGCFANAGVLGTLEAVSGGALHLELFSETYPVWFGSSEQGHEVHHKKFAIASLFPLLSHFCFKKISNKNPRDFQKHVLVWCTYSLS